MMNKSDGSLYSAPLARPPSGLNPGAQVMTQPVQLVQAVPVLHQFYPQPVPVVMSQVTQVPRMPVTMLPQPMTTNRKFQHPFSSYRNSIAT